ncbi:unnamed protein product [Leptosia nina]|uniref:FAM194 C-terminal domain-containing protein n=1 Tax=Leptosia nina TaxID=320188 RepID=A0AAV1J572_9NEOP
MTKLRYTLILIFLFSGALNVCGDDFKEEIYIKPLPPMHLYTYFQFITLITGSNYEHSYLAPRSITEIMTRFQVEELHLTLTEGQWRHKQWGYPVTDAAPGAELYAWFSPSVTNIDKQWKKLSSTLSGLFCASLNFIDGHNTITPKMALSPLGAVDISANYTPDLLRYASLPREIVCTENLTPWKKLLPCESNFGFSSLLNSRLIHNTNYHSIGVHVRKVCTSKDCTEYQFEIKQTVALVYDFKIINSNNWSFKLLFGQGLFGACPLSSSSKVYIDITSNDTIPFKLSPQPSSVIKSLKGGSDTMMALYDISPDSPMLNIAAKYSTDNKLLVSPPPPLYFNRYVLGYGKEFGGIVTEITNSYWAPIDIILLENAPWWLPIQLSTLRINGEAKSKLVMKQYYSPGRSRQKPYHLELLMKLPPKSTTTVSIDFEFVFLKWQEYPPDANHGFYIGSALISAKLPTAKNYTSLPVNGVTFESVINASKAWYPAVFRTNGAMVSLPTPDFSMPYNVICLACTVVALAFGPLHNICTKELVLKAAGGALSLRQKIINMFVKFIMTNEEHLHNNVMDQNDDLIKRLENYIKCPRCKLNLKCYRRKITRQEKIYCKNVCDHCLNEYLLRKSSKTREIDKKAITKESSAARLKREKVKLWLSRIIDLLESNLINYKRANLSKQAERRAFSSVESRYTVFRSKRREPELEPMFEGIRAPGSEKTDVKIKPTKRGIRYLEDFPQYTNNVEPTQFMDSETKLETRNEILSLNTSDDNVTVSSADIHLKMPLLQDKLQVLKNVILEDDNRVSFVKHREEKYPRSHTAKRTSVGNKRPDYSRSTRKQLSSETLGVDPDSLETLKTSISDLTEKTLDQNFSYFFLKEVGEKHPIRHHKSSSEIIKDTIDMLSERAKLKRSKKDEEERKREQEKEKKHLARIEKIQQEAKSNLKELVEEKKELIIVADHNLEGEKLSIQSKSIKSAKIKLKEKKSPIEKIKPQTKPSKDEFKKEREEKLAMERERKFKEKEAREERSKLDKEKKMQEKAEKEERLRFEKEQKLKDKEEKERLKREKADQLQKEKEDKRKQGEIQEKPKDEPKPKERPVKDDKMEEKKVVRESGDAKRMQEHNEKKFKEEALLKLADIGDSSTIEDKSKPRPKKEEDTTFKELNISKVKLRKPSQDNLILQLVKLKQSEGKKEDRVRSKRLSEINVSPLTFQAHQNHKLNRGNHCILCDDSELELDVDNIFFSENRKQIGNQQTDAIVGQKIVKVYRTLTDDTKEVNEVEPLLFQSTFVPETPSPNNIETEVKDESKPSPQATKRVDPEASKGVIRYALSDRSFIEKGWTMLPTEKVVRKMNVYRMRPAHPEFDWFEHNKNKKLMHYESGEKLAEFDDDGKGRWFYRNGRLALDYYDAEELNAQQRFVIYSNGEPDERGRSRPFTILATFDYLGNGVVFDHSGKIRLKYNQTEGVVLDKNIGPVSHWKWHTLNDPPVLQQVMIDTQMAHKDPDILKLGGPGDDKPRHDNEEMLAIEFDNFIKEKSKKLSQKFKPFQIKMKALKINENFSLKVLDQATVYLIFRDGSTNLKLNIGMILDHQEIVDTDTAEVGEVSNSLERFPAKTDSLAGLQQSVAHAQRVERARLERERRLRPSQSCTSADKLATAASKPLRPPFRTAAASSNISSSLRECRCKYRKPSTCNIYYDTRLI